MIFVWTYFLGFYENWILQIWSNFKKLKKLVHAKTSPRICLYAIYDALIKVLILSLYSSDSLPGSFSIARQNS